MPSLESLSSLGFEGGKLGCPGILPGCPRPLGVLEKFVQKSSFTFFVPYARLPRRGHAWETFGHCRARGPKGRGGSLPHETLLWTPLFSGYTSGPKGLRDFCSGSGGSQTCPTQQKTWCQFSAERQISKMLCFKFFFASDCCCVFNMPPMVQSSLLWLTHEH